MTRLDLLAHAEAMLTELANEASVSLADDGLGIKSQLDAALRDLGDDTANTAAAEALTEYHVLRRLRYAVAARVDANSATAVQRNKSQVFHQIETLITDAANRAAAAGHPVTPAGTAAAAPAGLSLVRFPLGWTQGEAEEYEQ